MAPGKRPEASRKAAQERWQRVPPVFRGPIRDFLTEHAKAETHAASLERLLENAKPLGVIQDHVDEMAPYLISALDRHPTPKGREKAARLLGFFSHCLAVRRALLEKAGTEERPAVFSEMVLSLSQRPYVPKGTEPQARRQYDAELEVLGKIQTDPKFRRTDWKNDAKEDLGAAISRLKGHREGRRLAPEFG